ncbi:chromosome partitioning protein, ParB family [Seinonella peptonophila]|uniref:Chromosome partitioning protein, ParB family n=1 Tax=Seinonella peptonophila TaxID=112248 RepID=A0A1M4WYL9_9BACL|nr:nucleoid occlusion protein [Seinonella peptonophila]SHE86329.1 chromosome partitioning protein, ParB family [Seinonella peptonophila]
MRLFGLTDREQDQVKQIAVHRIQPSPYQPRVIFDDERLEELCQTIQIHGVIQPVVLRRIDAGYELIAGERRWRAVQKLQLPTIPAIIREMGNEEAAAVALIENLQREELTAIEEAQAYQKLIELHQLTQEQLAKRLGKGQSTIANKLRLLQLPLKIQQALSSRTISERHARALLPLKSPIQQLTLLEEIIERKLTVKQTEERVRRMQFTEKEDHTKAMKARKNYSRDVRIAVNTIRHSIEMVRQTGMMIETIEQDDQQFIEMTIRIPKQEN